MLKYKLNPFTRMIAIGVPLAVAMGVLCIIFLSMTPTIGPDRVPVTLVDGSKAKALRETDTVVLGTRYVDSAWCVRGQEVLVGVVLQSKPQGIGVQTKILDTDTPCK